LATGLVQLAWLCRYVVDHGPSGVRATTQLETFRAGGAALLIAEAMVTSDGKPEAVSGGQDHADAVAAAKRLAEILHDPRVPVSVVHCGEHAPFNLAAASCLHAGLAIDATEHRRDVLVAKVRPRLGDSNLG
jgi:hypothetical protein